MIVLCPWKGDPAKWMVAREFLLLEIIHNYSTMKIYLFFLNIMSVPITATGLQGSKPLAYRDYIRKGIRQIRCVTSGEVLALLFK